MRSKFQWKVPSRFYIRILFPMELPGIFWTAFLPAFLLIFGGGISGDGESKSRATPGEPLSDSEVKLEEWLQLDFDLYNRIVKEPEGRCNASVDLSYAYFLLKDLLEGHKSSGIQNWAWPRPEFYLTEDKFQILREEKLSYLCPIEDGLNGEKSTCWENEGSAKCVACSLLPRIDADKRLHEGCDFRGNSGELEHHVEVERLEEIPKATKTALVNSPEECPKNFLTSKFVKDKHSWLKKHVKSVIPHKDPLVWCTNYPEMARAFAYLETLAGKMSTIESELEEFRGFYEDKLRVLVMKPSVEKPTMCSAAKEDGRGPWVCGVDGICVECRHIEEDAGELIYEACHVEDYPKKGHVEEGCQLTPTTTTTEEMSTSAETTTEVEVTTQRSGVVGVGRGSRWSFAVGVAVTFLWCNVF